jgi:hypothetical protein
MNHTKIHALLRTAMVPLPAVANTICQLPPLGSNGWCHYLLFAVDDAHGIELLPICHRQRSFESSRCVCSMNEISM